MSTALLLCTAEALLLWPQELCWILDARLADIREAWQAGRLQQAGITRAELERLILALFEDTDMRRSVLGFLKQ